LERSEPSMAHTRIAAGRSPVNQPSKRAPSVDC
jgi:hypothetical protein